MTNLLKNAIKEEMAREIADDLRDGGYTFDVKINGVSITPFDFDVYAAIVESIHNGNEGILNTDVVNRLFGIDHTDKEHEAVSRSFDRLSKIGLFDWAKDNEDYAQDDTSAELETLIDCIIFIERYGDTKANREKATKTARRLLSDIEGRLVNFDDALSDFHRSIGSGILPF